MIAGQYYDDETSLHYNWNRYYSPELGRYLTSDPLGLAADLNTYAYVGNSPLNFLDPFGLNGISATAESFVQSSSSSGSSSSAGRMASSGAQTAAKVIVGGAAGRVMWALSPSQVGDATLDPELEISYAGAPSDTSQIHEILKDDYGIEIKEIDGVCPLYKWNEECAQIQAQISQTAAEIRERYFAGLLDRHDLYNKAYSERNLGKRKGTWLGHRQQLRDKIRKLKGLIDEADRKGCYVSPQDRALLGLEFPDKPANR